MTWIQSTQSYRHNRKCPNPCASNIPFCFAVPYVCFVWKGLFVENIMSMIFEFSFYSNKFHSICNLYLLYSSLFSHFSVSSQSVLLFVYKRRSALASFLRQDGKNFPHVFVWESSEKKAQPVTDSSVDEKTRRVSWLAKQRVKPPKRKKFSRFSRN